MDRTFTKSLFFFIILSLFTLGTVFAQTITIGSVDPGPYAPGSSIGVPISVTGTCVNTTTTYKLYLSNAAGSFAAKTLIGTFTSFYTTFVNGVIPPGTPAGNGYQVEVISSSPTITSIASASFQILAGTPVTAAVSSQVINTAYPNVFGACNGTNNTNYNFVNQSTAGSTVTATIANNLLQSAAVPFNPNGTFSAAAANYTITVKAVLGGIESTQCYLLINNAVNNVNATGNYQVCLNGDATVNYTVDITSANGIQNNFPGLIYNINWEDGQVSALTLCDIQNAGGKISHTYTKSSCGKDPDGQSNSFAVNFQPNSIYCGNIGPPTTKYVQAFNGPTNSFTPVNAGCTNNAVTFNNTSDPGQDPTNTAASCAFANAQYTWTITSTNGTIINQATNYSFNQSFSYTFTVPGTYHVTLHLTNTNALCTASDVTHDITIENTPTPAFTLSSPTTGCAPLTVNTTNNTVISSVDQYIWTVSDPNVTYASGNANSPNPSFVFSTPGTYTVQLGVITAGCGTITAPPQTVTISSQPVATLSPNVSICGTSPTLSFSPDPNSPTNTFLSGNAQTDPSSYSWQVTPNNVTFANGTQNTSQYPQITFPDPNVQYTVMVTNKNSCGTVSATQFITISPAPNVSAGSNQSFCANTAYPLQGSITNGTVNSFSWTGGTGTFSPDRTSSLTPNYTPSAAEIAAGTVTLTLNAVTGLTGSCANISNSVTLTITQPDVITSSPTANACSGTQLNYLITASDPTSTFTWTIDQANTSASASGYTNNGTGASINDAIVNSDPNNNATVTYDITAVGSNTCLSNKFALTVTVAPKVPVAKFTQDQSTGCGTLTVQFTNASVPNNASSAYTWNFGDGSTSTDVNPSHTFASRTDGKDTVYTISLISTSSCGVSQPAFSTVTVSPQTPVAYITPKQITGCSPFTLAVDNFSPGNNKQYDYYLYNGATLVQQITTTDKSEVRFNPLTVTATTQYSLYMVATNLCGTTGQSIIIPITVSATTVVSQMFIDDGISKGCAPYTVNFINNSIGGDNYYYTIYDVNNVVVDRRPGGTAPLSYTFNTAGTFYVTITAANSCTTVESSPPIRVDVFSEPLPQFTADVTSGCKNLTVNFTNQTPDDPSAQATSLAYDWNFGDGSPDETTFTPQPHTYNFKNSPYTVTLTATNLVTNCSNVITKTAYINIIAPPATQFTENPDSVINIPDYHFSFIDETSGGAVSWSWSFGDGQTSISQNPGHTYIDTGSYKVTLTATSQAGCDSTISHNVRITGIPGQLFLPNAFEPDGGTTQLRTFMAKGSGIKEWHMQIFNNYGQLVWETTRLDDKGAPIDGWDGTFKGAAAPQGVYVWQVSATFINGTQWKGNVIENSLPKRTGVVNLIR